MVGNIIGEIAEYRPGLGINVAQGLCVKTGQANCWQGTSRCEQHIKYVKRAGIEIISAQDAVEIVAFIQDLELLTELVILIDNWNVEILRRQAVKVDIGGRFILAIRGDAF